MVTFVLFVIKPCYQLMKNNLGVQNGYCDTNIDWMLCLHPPWTGV